MWKALDLGSWHGLLSQKRPAETEPEIPAPSPHSLLEETVSDQSVQGVKNVRDSLRMYNFSNDGGVGGRNQGSSEPNSEK